MGASLIQLRVRLFLSLCKKRELSKMDFMVQGNLEAFFKRKILRLPVFFWAQNEYRGTAEDGFPKW